jgi:RNA polymerase sigma factor (sigma-70 family)
MDHDRGVSCDRFEALYAEHCKPLLAYALRRTAQPANAADVVAETFLVAWRRLDAVPEDEPRLWLYGVAHRVLANHHRGRRRREQLSRRLGAVIAEHVVADPAEAIGMAALVRDAMEHLPADDREILRLTAWEGLSSPQIAVVLGIPPATVRTRLRRARRRFREAMGCDPGQEEGKRAGPIRTPKKVTGNRSSQNLEGRS